MTSLTGDCKQWITMSKYYNSIDEKLIYLHTFFIFHIKRKRRFYLYQQLHLQH